MNGVHTHAVRVHIYWRALSPFLDTVYNFVVALWVYIFTYTLNDVDKTDQTIHVCACLCVYVYNKHKSRYNILCMESGFLLVLLVSKTTKNYIHPYTSQNLTDTQTKITKHTIFLGLGSCELCIRSQFPNLS